MQPRRAPRKCALCQKEIPEGVPFERTGDRVLHIPCANDMALASNGVSTLFRRQDEDSDRTEGVRSKIER